ncbi:MAG: hypothetical protein K1X89_06135 [Myxococcaceae bacterium]|nr:hypothetical protein [Myxococcaceae bacterium]
MSLIPLLVAATAAAPAPFVLPAPGGELALVHGVLSAPQPGDLALAAKRFAESRRDELGLGPTDTLEVVAALGGRFGGAVHLAQHVGGLEVHGSRVVVTFDSGRRVVRLASSIRRASSAALTPRLTGPQALAAAAKEIDGALLDAQGQVQGGYAPRAFFNGSALHAGYLVWVPTLRSSQDWHAAVDATTGDVLWVEDRALHAVDAQVYDPSPGGIDAGVGKGPLTQVMLTHLRSDGGQLDGEHIRAFNCCPTANCLEDAGAKRATGMLQTFQGPVNFDVAICDRVQRASNDPAVNPDANYVYEPVDPPSTLSPSYASKADFDTFAEVQAYYHVNRVYDFVEALSTGPFGVDAGLSPFILRDLKTGQVPAVWVNSSEPDFSVATQNGQGVYVSNQLSRVENAVFMPREQMQFTSVPQYAFTTDALVIYQGNHADFAYDAPVMWHEFGHGVVYSTSNWQTVVTFDNRSANNESSALHEGTADVFAFMTGNESKLGVYVSPRSAFTTELLRNADNQFKCPDVLWGESHQDSQHYAGALWQARSTAFAADKATFDAAFYAAVISFPPDVGFEKAAAIISASVGQAFSSDPQAESKMKAIFDQRGVSHCSKVLDVSPGTGKRDVYIIPGADFSQVTAGEPIPGPYQMKIHVPKGAKSLKVSGPYFGFQATPTAQLQLLVKSNAPITFAKANGKVTNDADLAIVPSRPTNQTMEAVAPIAVPCGGDLYFTVANTSRRDRQMQNLAYTYTEADTCEVPDAGSDAGVMTVDDAGVADAGAFDAGVGNDAGSLPAVPDPLGNTSKGCGCSTGVGPGLLLALALLRRRARR